MTTVENELMVKDDMPIDPDVKKLVYSAVVSGGSDLYKMTVTVATTFLGGSLLYVEKFVDLNKLLMYWPMLVLLGSGFVALVIAIGFSIRSQLLTQKQGNEVINPDCDSKKVKRLGKRSDRYTSIANTCLICGMSAMMLFGFLNLILLKGKAMSSEMNRSNQDMVIIGSDKFARRSIDHGAMMSNTPSTSSPAPASQTGTQPNSQTNSNPATSNQDSQSSNQSQPNN